MVGLYVIEKGLAARPSRLEGLAVTTNPLIAEISWVLQQKHWQWLCATVR